MKGQLGIYLLAVALVTDSLSGCAREDVLETPPFINMRSHLVLGPGNKQLPPGAYITTIYSENQPTIVFTPSFDARDLWLATGKYVAMIESCGQAPKGNTPEKYWVRLGPDHLFKFSVGLDRLYYLACATYPDGSMYVWLEGVLPPGALD